MGVGRHGRAHRAELRAEKRKPELRHPETGRLLRYSKFADRQLLVMVGGTPDTPVTTWMSYDEIAERNHNGLWISHKNTKKFGKDATLEQRCWVSGVQLYFVPYSVLETLNKKPTWRATRDHLVCVRNGGRGHGDSNIVMVGEWVNDKIGHNPLPLKLLLRAELAKSPYERELPTYAAVGPVIERVMEVENQFRLGNGYPWQPWTFAPGTQDHATATAFHAEMRAAEDEFLSLDAEGRRQWLAEFRWRW
jgi:hypothetical protein